MRIEKRMLLSARKEPERSRPSRPRSAASAVEAQPRVGPPAKECRVLDYESTDTSGADALLVAEGILCDLIAKVTARKVKPSRGLSLYPGRCLERTLD